MPGHGMKEYVTVPATASQGAALRRWIGDGLAYAQTLPAKTAARTKAAATKKTTSRKTTVAKKTANSIKGKARAEMGREVSAAFPGRDAARSAASQNRDRTRYRRPLRPRVCRAPLREGLRAAPRPGNKSVFRTAGSRP